MPNISMQRTGMCAAADAERWGAKHFYEKLGFRVILGDQAKNWLILQNETSTASVASVRP